MYVLCLDCLDCQILINKKTQKTKRSRKFVVEGCGGGIFAVFEICLVPLISQVWMSW